jgi:hypothetical protein
MRLRNESARKYIIKGIELPAGKIIDLDDETAKKLVAAYAGELVAIDNLKTDVKVEAEVAEDKVEQPKKGRGRK